MPKLTAAAITKLGVRRREVMALIDELTKEKATIDAKLLTADLDKQYEGNGVIVGFTSVHTLDGPTITKKFPADAYPDYYKLTLDTAEFKKDFSANELAAYQKVSHRISVKDA